MTEKKTSWREKFVAVILIIAGTLYLLLQSASLLSRRSWSITATDETININKFELLNDVRTICTIVFCLLGGISLLRGKKIGWMLGMPILLVLLAVSAAGWMWISSAPGLLTYVVVPLASFVLATAVIFMFLKPTRQKLNLATREYLLTAILTAVMFALYFLLQ